MSHCAGSRLPGVPQISSTPSALRGLALPDTAHTSLRPNRHSAMSQLQGRSPPQAPGPTPPTHADLFQYYI